MSEIENKEVNYKVSITGVVRDVIGVTEIDSKDGVVYFYGGTGGDCRLIAGVSINKLDYFKSIPHDTTPYTK